MKKLVILFLLAFGLAVSSAWAAGFTANRVVVLQCGNIGTGTAGTLIEYNQAGATDFQVALPSTGSDAIVFGNNSTLNHDIQLSGDGAFVVVGGYANTFASVDSATGANSPRVVALVKYDGTYARPFISTTALSGTAVRSAAADGFGNFWGNGNSAPTYLNTATTLRSGAVRVTAIFNGNLHYSPAAGAYAYAGTPTMFLGDGALTLSSASMGANATASGYAFPANPVEGSKAYLVDYNGTSERRDWPF